MPFNRKYYQSNKIEYFKESLLRNKFLNIYILSFFRRIFVSYSIFISLLGVGVKIYFMLIYFCLEVLLVTAPKMCQLIRKQTLQNRNSIEWRENVHLAPPDFQSINPSTTLLYFSNISLELQILSRRILF